MSYLSRLAKAIREGWIKELSALRNLSTDQLESAMRGSGAALPKNVSRAAMDTMTAIKYVSDKMPGERVQLTIRLGT